MSEGAAVQFRDVTFGYNGEPAVDGVSLDIHERDFLGIIGPNGGGKTTLVKLMLGMLTPWQGSITIFGNPPRKARGAIGYVPQYQRFESQFPVSVCEVVLTGRLGHRGIGRRYGAADRGAVEKALADVDMLDLRERSLSALSGGERQRVLVARALATEPRMLVLDEPTASVDSRMEHSFYELLRTLHARIPIVLVSHDLGFISSYVTRVACINRRLTVNDVGDIHALELEELYNAPVKMWSHNCKL